MSLLAERTWYATRRFDMRRSPGGMSRKLLIDDTRLGIGDTASRVSLDLGPDARGWPIAWVVSYQRVAHPNAVGEADAELEGAVELARGVEASSQ
jgi:hypothetical protein